MVKKSLTEKEIMSQHLKEMGKQTMKMSGKEVEGIKVPASDQRHIQRVRATAKSKRQEVTGVGVQPQQMRSKRSWSRMTGSLRTLSSILTILSGLTLT